jgi:hypothetical protein
VQRNFEPDIFARASVANNMTHSVKSHFSTDEFVKSAWLNLTQYMGIVNGLKGLKPAAHERTCRAYLVFVTSWIDKISSCAGNIYGIFVIRDM